MGEQQDDINRRLLAVQSKLKAPKGQYNSFGKYSYRNQEDILESVKPLLKEEELLLVISDKIVRIGERFYVKSEACVFLANESIRAFGYAREASDKKGMDDSQITGAASSYARKYALNGLFCIDDTKDADSDESTSESKPKTAATGAPPNPTHTPSEKQLTTIRGMMVQVGYSKEKRDEVLARVKTFQQASDLISQLREMLASKRQETEVKKIMED